MTPSRLLPLAAVAVAALALAAACSKDEPAPIQEQLDGFDPRGASLAKFSVGMNRYVRFSRGNMQFQASTRQWRFAPNQYDLCGTANENISATNSQWIDLFGFGTSGWEKSGATFFQPWETSDSAAGYGPGTNSLAGNTIQADWAYFNPIQYGGDTAKYWRTLSAAEWRYLLTGRNNAVNKITTATVCGVKGLIILPDEWTPPEGISITTSLSDTVDFQYTDVNKYSADDWRKLQASGVIFLPAAGSRTIQKTTDVERYGYYWSSSAATEETANCVAFSARTLHPETPLLRHHGLALRPVVDAR